MYLLLFEMQNIGVFRRLHQNWFIKIFFTLIFVMQPNFEDLNLRHSTNQT